MISEVVAGGFRYRCSDIGPDPSFDALVFTLKRERP